MVMQYFSRIAHIDSQRRQRPSRSEKKCAWGGGGGGAVGEEEGEGERALVGGDTPDKDLCCCTPLYPFLFVNVVSVLRLLS